jgi:hypothetical protein
MNAENVSPRRDSFTQRGGNVVPVLGPSLAVAPPAVRRRRSLAFPSLLINIVAWRVPAASDSRNVMPPIVNAAPAGSRSELTRAMISPLPFHGRCTKWNASARSAARQARRQEPVRARVPVVVGAERERVTGRGVRLEPDAIAPDLELDPVFARRVEQPAFGCERDDEAVALEPGYVQGDRRTGEEIESGCIERERRRPTWFRAWSRSNLADVSEVDARVRRSCGRGRRESTAKSRPSCECENNLSVM